MTSNYPPGTWGGDPDAPWNRRDPWEGQTCDTCRFANWMCAGDGFCLYAPMAERLNEISKVCAKDAACEAWEAV